MDDAYSKTVILACAAVALVVFIAGSFIVYRQNQEQLQGMNGIATDSLDDQLNDLIVGD